MALYKGFDLMIKSWSEHKRKCFLTHYLFNAHWTDFPNGPALSREKASKNCFIKKAIFGVPGWCSWLSI